MWLCFTAGQRKPLCRVLFDTYTVIVSGWHTFKTNSMNSRPIASWQWRSLPGMIGPVGCSWTCFDALHAELS